MISLETPRASGAARSAHVQLWSKRIMMATAAFLLAAAFVFMGASSATAASTDSTLIAPCRGDKPGFCPDSSTASLGEQRSAQPRSKSTTRRSNEQPVSYPSD
jgi:hypothetical protein